MIDKNSPIPVYYQLKNDLNSYKPVGLGFYKKKEKHASQTNLPIVITPLHLVAPAPLAGTTDERIVKHFRFVLKRALSLTGVICV